MKKTSHKYLQVDADIEKVISDLDIDLLGQKNVQLVDMLNINRKGLLPSWLFVEAVEQSPIAISITDRKANILYANKAFNEVTGYDISEVIGKNESILSYCSTPPYIYGELWRKVSGSKGEEWNGRLLNKHKNGEPYLADLSVSPMRDTKMKTTHYLGMHRDVSELYQVEKKFQNQKLLIESVLNSSSVAMVVIDQKNGVILDNQQYKRLVSDLGQKEPADLFIELLDKELGDVRAFLVDNPHGFNNIEVRFDDVQHNPAWFSCSGKVFQEKSVNADGFFEEASQDYLLLSISNITKQRQHQEEAYIQSLKVMLAEDEQVRSIRETLLGAIHQVKQPLNQIQAAIQLMQQKGETGQLLGLLKQLESSCEDTVSTLISNVPEIYPSVNTSVNINQILHEMLMINHSKFLSNGIIIDWVPSSVLPNILGSESKLRILFKQLIDNAINALNQSKNNERSIKITTKSANHRVNISIADTGPGIPSEHQAKVFQPFFSTQENGSLQSGMGLVMAKEIVHSFNGTIEIDADYESGCCFNVSFPIVNHKDFSSYG